MNRLFPEFDRSRLVLEPLEKRQHDLGISAILPLQEIKHVREPLKHVTDAILSAKQKHSAVVLMMGAHVLRSGVQRYLIDLMERGLLSGIAMNGAGVIHDYEFALIGATTESVARYIKDGRFGCWQETARINDIVSRAAKEGKGLGEAVGQVIEEERFTYRDISVLAAGYRLRIPITVHVGIGYDILHEHPNCDGAAYGATSYTDFLRFTKVLESVGGGVVMNFGSAVMAPEVFLKSLAMVRNVARQEGRQIGEFTSLVCDLRKLPEDYCREAPRNDPNYFFRPWKTMLVRTLSNGRSYYVRGAHVDTIPELWTGLVSR